MRAPRGGFRSLVDVTAPGLVNDMYSGGGEQQQRLSAQVLWVLLMLTAPLMCPLYFLVTIAWVCLTDGRLSTQARVTIFVLSIFLLISWIPLVSFGIWYTQEGRDSDDNVNGLAPIVAFYLFSLWGVVVGFRRFRLVDAYEVETSRREVACLRDIQIEPTAIRLPRQPAPQKGLAGSMVGSMRGGRQASPAPSSTGLFSRLKGIRNRAGSLTTALDDAGPAEALFGDVPDPDRLTHIANALDLYVHLKDRPQFSQIATVVALTLAAATVLIVRTITPGDNQDPLFVLSTTFFCGMFLVFYATFAFIVVSYLHQVQFIQRLTTAICGSTQLSYSTSVVAIQAHNLSHLRAWEAVRRLAVLELTNPSSVLNSIFTPSMVLSAGSSLVIAGYLVIKLLFTRANVGQFILTLVVLLVLLLGFMAIVVAVAKMARSHLKLHTSIIAKKTYDVAKIIDERFADAERGLVNVSDRFSEPSTVTELSRKLRQSMSKPSTRPSGLQWGNTPEEEDIYGDTHRLLRNSSLANPDLARQQLEQLLQDRGAASGAAGTRPKRRPIAPRGEVESVAQLVTREEIVRPNARALPKFLMPLSGTVPVGFGIHDTQTATAVSSALAPQPPVTPVMTNTTSTLSHIDASPLPSSQRFADDNAVINLRNPYSNYSGSENDDTDTDAVESSSASTGAGSLSSLDIVTLEGCHASLASLCNFLVANPPRPLILGIELQNVRYVVVFVLLVAGNLMFLALMIAFKNGRCIVDPKMS